MGQTVLTKEEKFVCSMIWGGIPLDVKWVRETQIFKDAVERFKTDEDWKKMYENENKNTSNK